MSNIPKPLPASPLPPSLLGAWLLAARPKTLPVGAMPVVLGSALAFADGVFAPVPAFVALLCALLMQIASNLINDVYDFRKGADTAERLGPPRAVASGLLSERVVVRAAWIVCGVAFVLGQYLVWVGGWQIFAVGVVSLVAAWAYTGGPKPLAYLGLGELCAFVFYGVVPVCGTYFVQANFVQMNFVQTQVWSAQAAQAAQAAQVFSLSLMPGIFAANILMANNIRDISTDAASGKRTMPVRVGERAAKLVFVGLTGVAVLLPALLVFLGWTQWLLIQLICLLPSWLLMRRAWFASGAAYNAVLLNTVKLLIASSILVSWALFLSRFLAK